MRAVTLLCLAILVLTLQGVKGQSAEPIIIEDFESGSYDGWTIDGDAFDTSPAWGGLDHRLNASGHLGRQLIYSQGPKIGKGRGVNYSGNNSTGTMISPEFTIERSYISFLIGGGNFEGETCVNLIVNGDIVHTATGANSLQLQWHNWDVTSLQGKTARLQIVDKRQDEWGYITVDHIVQIDQPAHDLFGIEREIKFDDKYLIFPVDHDAPSQILNLIIDGERVLQMGVGLAVGDPDFWVFLNTADFPAEKVTLQAERLIPWQLDSFLDIRVDSTYPGEAELYEEELRPQLHFTSKRGWNNDPNGMVYYDGEYHLFYQHNPFGWDYSLSDINKSWGHAVSTNLINWTEYSDVIYPDENGSIYSGSGVVDWKNTTGFQTGDEPPLIAIYTYAGGTNAWSGDRPFTQGIAYSNDRGRTFTKYEGNPVLGHINNRNRDPKVIWWEETSEWIIVLYLSNKRIAFFRSPDLKRWELQSIMEGSNECPELFQLAVDGDDNNKKWILLSAHGKYFLGDFDGSKMIADGEIIQFKFGNCFYAAQTFSGVPEKDGRRILMAWGANDAPGMPFNQMMTFPVVLTLHSTDEGLRIFANPVKEIEKLYIEEHVWSDVFISEDRIETVPDVEGELFDIEAKFEIGDAQELGLVIRGEEVIYNVKEEQLIFGENKAHLKTENGRINLRCIVDKTSLEIFANDGRIYMSCLFRPEEKYKTIAVFSRAGSAKAASVKTRKLESIWK